MEKQPLFWFYGSAAMAYGIKNNAFSYLLLIYANQVLGVPGYLASIALAIAMLWDAVSDLLLGHWSDKTSSRLGRRHPFMYAALLVLPLSFYGLFNPLIKLDDGNTFFYLLVMAIIIRTGTTLFEVPSTALLPDLEKHYDQRNKWLALRYAFGWYGGNGIHTPSSTLSQANSLASPPSSYLRTRPLPFLLTASTNCKKAWVFWCSSSMAQHLVTMDGLGAITPVQL